MSISKKTREEAALICSIAALSTEPGPEYMAIADDLGLSIYGDAHILALNAWGHVTGKFDGLGIGWHREADAEAESLIRSGWSPGEEP